jgi:diguanylate cyclase (GGDEF)-like protein
MASHPVTAPDDAVRRMTEAEDTLRAIGAGEVDAFVVGNGESGQRVFSLSTADRPYRIFVESMREGAATVSSGGLVLFANQRLAELLGRPRETLLGSPLAAFVVGGLPNGLDELTGPGGLGATLELELLAGDGGVVPVLVGSAPLDVDGDRLTCLTFTDLSALKAQEHEITRLGLVQAARMTDLQDAQAALVHQATHDALTGLPNRALLVDRIDQALSQSRRSGRCTAVLFVDLDRFKQVNDTQGHAAGDALLQRVAERLVAALRPMDTVARIGGDEFAVLAPDIDSQMQAVDMTTRLIGELFGHVQRPEDTELVGASIGIAVSTGGRGSAETLLAEADSAMYQAKSLGGGRAEVFDAALGDRLHVRAVAQRMLQSALDERRIAVHYQSIVDLADGSVAGFEALARIAERDGTIVHPPAFITTAEDTGLVVPLDRQMLAMACEDAARWQPAGRALTVAVNLSSRQFDAGDLSACVHDTLERTGLDPTCLHLELTETAIMTLRPELLEQLARIRDLGVQIGLDDFGTGYASLTHLRRLPLTFVKIDRSFVQGLGTDQADDRIVAAVIDLAATLGLRSIAEGVETPAAHDRLRELGCDQAQGYLFAPPVPVTAIATAGQHAEG